ncbi:endonuclease/exonuclease/phosphatase family protein [Zeaxanthinibacter enoshimensis]|uniref:endonuclease/exonuclease/phosphatase family protein n=1 Tax=Zeaxanthinibacter enoshimensis TaxID=392009 RepID=UPI0035658832
MKLKIFLQVFGAIAVLLTIIPILAVDYWWIRMFDFTHLQLTTLTLIALLAYFIRFDIKSRSDYAFVIVLLACFIYQGYKIQPYTPLASYEVMNSEKPIGDTTLKVFAANVLQKNSEYSSLVREIQNYDADVVLLTETNSEWLKQISSTMDSRYPHAVKVPKDNTYGMLLYSKLPLVNAKVRQLVHDSIPSIHTGVILPSKDTLQLYCIHPTPPMPQENPTSTARDAEMMIIAKLSRSSQLPVIVLGDFNDVAWSRTTELFEKVSGLLDIRKGRGLYNTYNAKNPIMRWPLDHIFVAPDFRYLKMERGKKIGSDHFPVYVELHYEPSGAKVQRPPEVSAEVLDLANRMIREAELEERIKQQELRLEL